MDASIKSLEIQHQVKNNANELNDYLRGLGSWQAEMQAKDQQLLEAARQRKENDLEKIPNTKKLVSPPPAKRSVDKGAQKTKEKVILVKEPEESKCTLPDGNKKLKAYDYQGWDKFDADQACDEVEKENKETELNSDSKSDIMKDTANEENERNKRLIIKQEAAAEKERGNEYFKVRY